MLTQGQHGERMPSGKGYLLSGQHQAVEAAELAVVEAEVVALRPEGADAAVRRGDVAAEHYAPERAPGIAEHRDRARALEDHPPPRLAFHGFTRLSHNLDRLLKEDHLLHSGGCRLCTGSWRSLLAQGRSLCQTVQRAYVIQPRGHHNRVSRSRLPDGFHDSLPRQNGARETRVVQDGVQPLADCREETMSTVQK